MLGPLDKSLEPVWRLSDLLKNVGPIEIADLQATHWTLLVVFEEENSEEKRIKGRS